MANGSDAGKIRVGVVGLEPGRSWSARAHVPALRALAAFEIAAVCNSRPESAAAAAAAMDIPLWFGDHRQLVAHPGIDLVAVTVKVPHHLEIVTDALNAGKTVYCEWPLGNGLAEAEAMRDHARRAGVRGFVGLQARAAPAVAYLRDLIAQGFLGEVLSSTMIGSGMNWGAQMPRQGVYLADRANGATMLTIPFGHAVDMMCHVLGEFQSLSATTAIRRPTMTVVETGETIPKTAEDQVIVSGILHSGAAASAHYRGGLSTGTNFLWEINGTDGDIQVTAEGGHPQILDLALRGAKRGGQMEPLAPPDRYRWTPAELSGPAVNVAQAYAQVVADLEQGTHLCPVFDEAVVRHHMLAAIEDSARTGRRVELR